MGRKKKKGVEEWEDKQKQNLGSDYSVTGIIGTYHAVDAFSHI
jgi:hypothetical protein